MPAASSRATHASVPSEASAASSSATSCRAVGHPVVVGREARVGGELLAADHRAQPLPLALRVAGHGEVPVARAQRLVGRREPVRRAELARRAARRPQLGGLPDRERERALEQRRVDRLPAARALAGGERGEDADGAEQRGGEVADRDAALDRVAVGLAGHAHHARTAPGRSGRSPPAARTGRSARSRRSTRRQPRVERAQRLVVGAEPRRDARAVVLEQRRRRRRDEPVEGRAGARRP